MNSRAWRIGIGRMVALGAVLIAVAALLIVLDPSPAPAADGDPGLDFAATPVALDPIEPGDELDCDGEPVNSIETIVDASSIEEEGLATPVAIGEDGEIDSCVSVDVEPAAPEVPATEPDLPEEIDSDAAPDESGPAPTSAESGAPPPFEDPTLAGLAVDSPSTDPVSDPSLAGIPLSGEETESDVTDPMLAGVPAEEMEEEPPDDPLLAGLPEGDVASAAAVPKGRVDIDVMSPNGSVIPGGRISYIFQVSNPTKKKVSFRLQTEIDRIGWTSAVYAIGSATPLNSVLTLKRGESIKVVVMVSAPHEAVVGDRASTELNAVIVH